MVALPTESKTETAIYELYRKQRGDPRPYLGGSEIGETCERRLWYSFRWAFTENIEGRIVRLFETGNREEDRVVDDLKKIGCTVFVADPKTGKQYRFEDHGGHYSGGLDGVLKGLPDAPRTWHLLEVKTHNKKSFDHLKQHGVQKSKPKHYAQMQDYMRRAKLTRAVYVGVHKDTDRIHVERIEYVGKEATALLKKALRIIQSKEPPGKISEDPSWYECKFCPAHAQCHEEKVANTGCRTCVHATPELDGHQRWTCARYKCDIPEDNQRTGCESHLHIPALVPYAEPMDAGDDWIKYKMKDGREFVVCGPTGFPADHAHHYSSAEIAAINPASIGHPAVDAARTVLGGTVVG